MNKNGTLNMTVLNRTTLKVMARLCYIAILNYLSDLPLVRLIIGVSLSQTTPSKASLVRLEMDEFMRNLTNVIAKNAFNQTRAT